MPRSWQWSSRFPVDGLRVQASAVPVGFFVSYSFLPSKIAAQSMVKKMWLVGCIRWEYLTFCVNIFEECDEDAILASYN